MYVCAVDVNEVPQCKVDVRMYAYVIQGQGSTQRWWDALVAIGPINAVLHLNGIKDNTCAFTHDMCICTLLHRFILSNIEHGMSRWSVGRIWAWGLPVCIHPHHIDINSCLGL